MVTAPLRPTCTPGVACSIGTFPQCCSSHVEVLSVKEIFTVVIVAMLLKLCDYLKWLYYKIALHSYSVQEIIIIFQKKTIKCIIMQVFDLCVAKI